MNNNLNKKHGFSLAEALITLLIVCLITLASVPVLTKKKRNLSNNEHGKWMCTRNAAGEHVFWSKEAQNGEPENPETWTVAGNECKFVPPGNARNFALTAIGGGGGGAAGEFIVENKYGSGGSFSVGQQSDLRVLVIGAGGAGGSKTDDGCDKAQAYGGGSGAIYEGIHTFYPGINYVISSGEGGKYDKDDNDDGGNDGAKGHDGAASSIISNGSGSYRMSIIAGGGIGGRNYIKDGTKCKISDNDRGGEDGGEYKVKIGDGAEQKNRNGVTGNRASQDVSAQITKYSFIREIAGISFNNEPKLDTSSSSVDIGYGFGGFGGGNYRKDFDKTWNGEYSSCGGSERCWGQQGGLGLVKIYEFTSWIGGSGGAGQLASKFVPAFKIKSLAVRVGNPGAAGIDTNIAGGQGGNTLIDGLVAPGGLGGVPRKSRVTAAADSTTGENGGRSPLDPDDAGFGGAAGSCSKNGSYSCVDASSPIAKHFGGGGGSGSAGYSDNASGVKFDQSNGAQGAPGIVIVEW